MRITLSRLARVSAGYPFRGKIVDEIGGVAKVIQMRDVSKSVGINWQTVINTNVPLLNTLADDTEAWIKAGDIIFTARGNNNYAFEIKTTPFKTVLSPHLFKIRIKDLSMVAPTFLAWQINQNPAQIYFSKNTEGSAIVGIRRPVLDKVPIFLPPIEEQYKITKMIRCWKEEYDVLNALQDNHQNMINAIATKLLMRDK